MRRTSDVLTATKFNLFVLVEDFVEKNFNIAFTKCTRGGRHASKDVCVHSVGVFFPQYLHTI